MTFEDGADENNEQASLMVAELIQRIDAGAFVNGFVLAIEVMDSDGQRCLWALAPNGQKMWDSLGYVEAIRMMEQAKETADILGRD